MELNQIEKTESINQLFVFNDEFNRKNGVQEQIISSLLKHTPECIISFLLIYDVKIKFKTSLEFKTRKQDSNVAGFYSNTEKEIWILSSVTHTPDIITILHHEIGHFVDNVLEFFYYFEGCTEISLNSERNSSIRDILLYESSIYGYESYFSTSTSEFFAQSYCEYVLNSGLLTDSNRIYTFIEKNLSYLDTYFSLINPINKKIPYVCFLDDNCFISTIQEASSKNIQLRLFSKQNESKVLFDNISSFSVYKFDSWGDEVILEVKTSNNKYLCGLLNNGEVTILGANIPHPFNFLQQKTEYPFLLISDFNNKLDFVIKKHGCLQITSYLFNEIIPVDNNGDIIAIGVDSNCISFIGKDLSVLKTIPGKYVNHFGILLNGEKDPLANKGKTIVIKNHDTFDLYSCKGEYLNSCKTLEQFTTYGCEAFYDFIFIKYESHSELINKINSTINIVDFDFINICESINLSTFNLNSVSKYDPYERANLDTVKININGNLYISYIDEDSGELCDMLPISCCDDVFIPYMRYDSPYLFGFDFNDNSIKNQFTIDNIKNIKIIDIVDGTIVKDNLSYDSLISILTKIEETQSFDISFV